MISIEYIIAVINKTDFKKIYQSRLTTILELFIERFGNLKVLCYNIHNNITGNYHVVNDRQNFYFTRLQDIYLFC